MNKRICTVILTLLLLCGGGQNAFILAAEKSASLAASDIFTDKFGAAIILGRPTQNSMTASITTKAGTEIYLAYGEKSGTYTYKTEAKTCGENVPAVFVMDKISTKTVFYVVYYKEKGKAQYASSAEYQFSMPKAKVEGFNFVVQSDSHLLNKADVQLYRQSMQNMAALKPDFIFDLGDTFLLDNGGSDVTSMTQEKVDTIYRQQLPYFSIVAKNASLFLTLGNHESEYGILLDGTKNNLAAKSTIARTTYYPNPIANEYYSGNTDLDPLFGSLQNYYAFTWGNTLFVSIDPYRYSANGASEDNRGDGWAWTLGKKQYDWFRKTLEESTATYKFVFSHHAIGNLRGGAKIANLYEWGGYDQKGKYLFDQKRPGWGKPIQQIMKDTGVTIFFQGHDHLFAREDVDGVVYQTLPKPAEKIADKQNNFSSFIGDILLNSGFLNVSVSGSHIQVDYNRNYLVASGEQTTGVVYSYTVDAAHKVTVLKSTKDTLENYGKNIEAQTSAVKEGKAAKESQTTKADKTNKTDKTDKNAKTKTAKGNQYAENVGVGAVPALQMTSVTAGGFSFAIEADPHFDENSTDKTLSQTAANILLAKPSFLVDLGDTSMLEKLGKTPSDAAKRNTLVKNYFAQFGNLPIKMVTGNHDVPINTQKGNYYSFTQGNALFIMLDPYAFSTQTVGKGGGWATSLGKTQYDWLKNTLASSTAQYKFVFIHNLTGGKGKDSRGGAQAALFYEWGGLNENGVYEFSKMRPGWEMPIHDLLKKYGVQIVFHGHDHFYAREEKDGIVYQLVPQPGSLGSSVNDAAAYGYESGVLLPAAGYIRVVVLAEKAVVEYIKTEDDGSYTIPHVYTVGAK